MPKILYRWDKTVLALEAPEGASAESIDTFNHALATAELIEGTAYHVLKNNCVSSVAKILHQLDAKTTSPDVTMPWKLDKSLRRYCGFYCQETPEGLFIQKYQQKVDKEDCTAPYWAKKPITSLNDIIEIAYHSDRDEKTKSSLLELGWIIEPKKGLLLPTECAPEQFILGLIAYNKEQNKIARARQDDKVQVASIFQKIKERMQDLKDPTTDHNPQTEDNDNLIPP
jgi:hypothetical protein